MWRSSKRESYRLMQRDKEQGGVTAHSLHGSCSSSEKLDIEQQDLWRFFWSLLGNFQYFLPGSGCHSWNNRCACKILPGFPFVFVGVRKWEHGMSFAAPSPWNSVWAVVSYGLSGERMVPVCALPPAAKHSACLTELIGWAKCELVGSLSQHKGRKTNAAGNKIVKKIQKKQW